MLGLHLFITCIGLVLAQESGRTVVFGQGRTAEEEERRWNKIGDVSAPNFVESSVRNYQKDIERISIQVRIIFLTFKLKNFFHFKPENFIIDTNLYRNRSVYT